MPRLTIANIERTISCPPDRTLLQAAVEAGIDYPYTCASGNCGSCISRLDSGNVGMLPRGDAALTPEQVERGLILACRARPRGAVTVTWLGRGRK